MQNRKEDVRKMCVFKRHKFSCTSRLVFLQQCGLTGAEDVSGI